MVFARININEYTNKVLNIIKAKFELNTKSEAINKFIELFGEEVAEKKPKDQYIKKILEIEESHFKKYQNRKMSLEELDKICEVS